MTIIIGDTGEGLRVSEIIRRFRNLATDDNAEAYTWENAELYDWINDACFSVVKKLPTARVSTGIIALVDGAYQTLPSTRAIQLLDITRNMGSGGAIGRAIRVADRQLLDDQEPDWYTKARVTRLFHYTFDERNTRSFYVYPPAAEGVLVEAVYSEAPPKVDSTTDIVDMSEQYIDAIVNYVAYRAYSKDNEDGMMNVSQGYYAAFERALDIDLQSNLSATPNAVSS